VIDNLDDFRALDPFFRIIEKGLAEYADGEHFFDLLAEDVIFDFIITVPEYPRHVVGRDNLIELFRGYGEAFFLSRVAMSPHRSRSAGVACGKQWAPIDSGLGTVDLTVFPA
jgi:uncharacterized protein